MTLTSNFELIKLAKIRIIKLENVIMKDEWSTTTTTITIQ